MFERLGDMTTERDRRDGRVGEVGRGAGQIDKSVETLLSVDSTLYISAGTLNCGFQWIFGSVFGHVG